MANERESVELFLPAPAKLENAQNQIFSQSFKQFLKEAHSEFAVKINDLYALRLKKKFVFMDKKITPKFSASSPCKAKMWKIGKLPPRLKCRRLEMGDVSPANTAHFISALNCNVQSVQVDFDDGHCPTWKNQIQGYYNIIQVIEGKLTGAPCNISTCPILMLRPRAWNIIEHNVLINGKEIPGALLDFCVLMFHCGNKLIETGSGPFFYLSKVESASESKLWNDIFTWAQNRLSIPIGTIKACVLIENILSIFEAEDILYNLREHSLGLNCGIWDYIASILIKFGDRPEFILPDRMKYINSDTPFIKAYLQTVVKICHKRGAPATGGMIATVLNPGIDGNSEKFLETTRKVIDMKQKEIVAGIDGFLVYDVRLISSLNKLWEQQCGVSPNQIEVIPECSVTENDILTLPKGEMSFKSLEHNIAVSILFVYHWFSGVGHFFYQGNVEDSATAEISRMQVWQCIRHGVLLDDGTTITHALVNKIAQGFLTTCHKNFCRSIAERKRMSAAKYICLELFCALYPPDFITTYLNDSHKFKTIHNKSIISSFKSSL